MSFRIWGEHFQFLNIVKLLYVTLGVSLTVHFTVKKSTLVSEHFFSSLPLQELFFKKTHWPTTSRCVLPLQPTHSDVKHFVITDYNIWGPETRLWNREDYGENVSVCSTELNYISLCCLMLVSYIYISRARKENKLGKTISSIPRSESLGEKKGEWLSTMLIMSTKIRNVQ